MRKGNKRKQKKGIKIDRIVKLLGVIAKMVIIGIFVYVIIDRCGDINGIDFFFTTWK